MLWGIYSAIYGEINVSVEKCVEIKGDYVEKQRSCFISVTLKSWSGRELLQSTTYKRVYVACLEIQQRIYIFYFLLFIPCIFIVRYLLFVPINAIVDTNNKQ
jgi:hypothetical protein